MFEAPSPLLAVQALTYFLDAPEAMLEVVLRQQEPLRRSLWVHNHLEVKLEEIHSLHLALLAPMPSFSYFEGREESGKRASKGPAMSTMGHTQDPKTT